MKNVNEATAPQQTHQKFLKDMAEKGKALKIVRSHWPYDYDADFKAYEVKHNGNRFYFCFGSEGQLLQKKLLTKFD